MTEPAANRVDPAQHLMSGRWDNAFWYDEPAPPGPDESPVPLDALVAQWRGLIEAASEHEPARRLEVVVISAVRAQVIAYLLRELSNRLRPGQAVGTIQSNGSLSRFIAELAEDLFIRSR
jgi:hypothetical protein